MSLIENLKQLSSEGRIDEAISLATDALGGELTTDERAGLLFERGMLYWRTGNRSKAMTDYMGAVDLDPESPARQALEQARDIEDFFNPDIFNP